MCFFCSLTSAVVTVDACTTAMLQGLFEGIGPIKHAFVVTAKGSSECTGEGFIAFRSGTCVCVCECERVRAHVSWSIEDDAKKALEKMQGKQVMDRKLKVSFAKHRKRKQALLDDDEDLAAAVNQGGANTVKGKAESSAPQVVVPRKHARGRLIVRNLSFKAKEEDLRTAFSPFGKLIDGKQREAIFFTF